MYTINGLPYIDLSTNIDLSRLISIQNEIVFGIVKSRELITEGGASSWNCLNRDIPSIVDVLHNPNCTTHIHNKNGLYYEFYKKLNYNPDLKTEVDAQRFQTPEIAYENANIKLISFKKEKSDFRSIT